MSVFASMEAYNRVDDWLIGIASIAIFFLILYPLYVLYLRYRHSMRIKRQLVTSMYKLPIEMNPVELAYIFSSKVKKPQLFSTLLNLANRSVLLMHKHNGKITVDIGPKVDKNLRSFEKLLIEQISTVNEPVDVEVVIEGHTIHQVSGRNTEHISGSRQYVFWWLLRDSLRKRNIIQSKLSKRYALIIFIFGVLGSLTVSVASIVTIRTMQMINAGGLETGRITSSFASAISLWALSIIPMILISFGLLKYRGKMLGRHWIVTEKYKRYVGQMDAFREFVRLTHKDKLRFESKELKKESIALTRPYAIACGYVKK
jgi:hypothetical protein